MGGGGGGGCFDTGCYYVLRYTSISMLYISDAVRLLTGQDRICGDFLVFISILVFISPKQKAL